MVHSGSGHGPSRETLSRQSVQVSSNFDLHKPFKSCRSTNVPVPDLNLPRRQQDRGYLEKPKERELRGCHSSHQQACVASESQLPHAPVGAADGTMFHGIRMMGVRGTVGHYQKRGRIGLGGEGLARRQPNQLRWLGRNVCSPPRLQKHS